MALRKKTSPRPDTNQAPDSEEPTSTGEGSGAQDEDPTWQIGRASCRERV